jgi:nucleoside phosphorylase
MASTDFDRGNHAAVDVAIICMIAGTELHAIRHVLKASGAVETGNAVAYPGWEYFKWRNALGLDLRLVVACCDGQSNLEAAITTLVVLPRHEPRFAFLCGIAGGMAIDKYRLGDVVVAADVIYRRFSKIKADGSFRPESDNVPASHGGRALATRFFARHPNARKIQSPHNDGELFAVHAEKVLSWDLVLDHAPTKETLLTYIDGQFAVVETEGAGFLKAVASHARNNLERLLRGGQIGGTDALVVRGISDPAADKAQTDAGVMNWRRIAARNAAQTVLLLLDMLSDHDFAATPPA